MDARSDRKTTKSDHKLGRNGQSSKGSDECRMGLMIRNLYTARALGLRTCTHIIMFLCLISYVIDSL